MSSTSQKVVLSPSNKCKLTCDRWCLLNHFLPHASLILFWFSNVQLCIRSTCAYIHLLFSPYRTCPEGYVLGSLEECHIKEVSEEWHRMDHDRKISLFTEAIKQQHSFGIFPKHSGKIDKSPVGWCLQYPSGFFGHLFVHEEHRRKGLAKILVQHMCCSIKGDGEVPLAFVRIDNVKSMSLFQSLNFVQSDFQATIFHLHVI